MNATLVIAFIALGVSFFSFFFVLYRGNGSLKRDISHDQNRQDETGELSPGAKQAVRDYMSRLFVGAGIPVALLAGVTGYMINDLAKEKAISSALNNIQGPLLTQLKEATELTNKATSLATQVESLSQIVETEKFVNDVVKRLSENPNLKQRIEDNLVNNVSNELATKHSDQLRGEKGEPGNDGTSPDVDTVAKLLSTKYRKQLRGDKGERGNDGSSPSVSAVTTQLAEQVIVSKLCGTKGEEEDELHPTYVVGTGPGSFNIAMKEGGGNFWVVQGEKDAFMPEGKAQTELTILSTFGLEAGQPSKKKELLKNEYLRYRGTDRAVFIVTTKAVEAGNIFCNIIP